MPQVEQTEETIQNLYAQIQKLSDSFDLNMLHQKLDNYANRFCSVAKELCQVGYHWSMRITAQTVPVMLIQTVPPKMVQMEPIPILKMGV